MHTCTLTLSVSFDTFHTLEFQKLSNLLVDMITRAQPNPDGKIIIIIGGGLFLVALARRLTSFWLA